MTTGLLGLAEVEAVHPAGVALAAFNDKASVPLVRTAGWHNLSFAMLWPDYESTAMQLRQSREPSQEWLAWRASNESAECPPEACHPGTRFKVLGVHSC